MDRSQARLAFIERVRQARVEAYGEDGIEILAEDLGIPAQTWKNYEAGVTIPDLIILHFVCLTSVAPRWLLAGDGPAYAPLAKPIIRSG